MREYSTALELLERALMCADGLPRIFEAQCHLQIGHAIELQGAQMPRNFSMARAKYEQALDLYENHVFPTDEVALALCYTVIGNCYFFISASTDDSHRWFLKAIDVYDAIFLLASPPPTFTQQVRFLLVGVLFHIALHYYRQLHLLEQAQNQFQRVVNYPIEHCPFDSYALAQRSLGEISFNHHKKYEQALDYFQKSIQFYESYTPENYWELAIGHQWLAKTYVKLGLDSDALDHAIRTIDILTQPEPSVPASVLLGSELSYLKQVAGFEQNNENTSRNQTRNQALSETYRLLGDIYERMEETDLALALYTCALDINRHFTPIYQLETMVIENRLKELYLKQNQKDEAMLHYRNALNYLKDLYTNMYG